MALAGRLNKMEQQSASVRVCPSGFAATAAPPIPNCSYPIDYLYPDGLQTGLELSYYPWQLFVPYLPMS